MQYLGVVVPVVVLAALIGLLALAAGVWGGHFGLRSTAGVVGVLGLCAMAALLPGAISTHLGYAVPWQDTPYHVGLRGRNYYHEGCDRKRPAQLVRIGRVYGYFTLSRPLWAPRGAAAASATPVVLWLGGPHAACAPVYTLSGGP